MWFNMMHKLVKVTYLPQNNTLNISFVRKKWNYLHTIRNSLMHDIKEFVKYFTLVVNNSIYPDLLIIFIYIYQANILLNSQGMSVKLKVHNMLLQFISLKWKKICWIITQGHWLYTIDRKDIQIDIHICGIEWIRLSK